MTTSCIYAHPAITTSPEYIWALQERLGLRAVVEGRRVRLVGEPQWSGRPAPPVAVAQPLALVNVEAG